MTMLAPMALPSSPPPVTAVRSVVAPPGRGHAARTDACPGALRTYGATDGAIARVRLAGAPLTIAQARGIGDIAATLGDGEVRFTTRANVQVRGLDEDGSQAFAAAVATLGLLPSTTHERARNIVVSPFCGQDVIDLARAIDVAICADPALAKLSGRFLVGIDDGTGQLLSLPLDLALQVRGGRVRLRLGSDVRGYDVGALDEPQVVAANVAGVAAVFRAIAADEGAWNVDDLSYDGTDELHAHVEGLFPATASLAVVRTQPALAGPLPRDEDGTVWVCATAPLASVPVEGWRALTDLAERADGELRVTPWHAVVVGGVDPAEVPAAVEALTRTGWVVSPDSAWVGVHGCTGAPQCARSLTPVHADTRALVQTGPFRMPISLVGCERRCGHPSVEHVDVVAVGPDEYALSVHDGTHGAQPGRMRTVRTPDLADAVHGLIAEHIGIGSGNQETTPARSDERADHSTSDADEDAQ